MCLVFDTVPCVMDEKKEKALEAFSRLLTILKRLRAPDGCPWDRKQTVETMTPLILEEAFEVADAVEAGERRKLAEELGDLSMNLLMTGLIAEEQGDFDLAEVFRKIAHKLVHRHPHVFGGAENMAEEPFLKRWEELKKEERLANNEDTSAVAGIPKAMPALLRSLRLLEKMKRTGADVPVFRDPMKDIQRLLGKIASDGGPKAEISEDHAGELLSLVTALCIGNRINPEMALRKSLNRLEEWFRASERAGLDGAAPEEINGRGHKEGDDS